MGIREIIADLFFRLVILNTLNITKSQLGVYKHQNNLLPRICDSSFLNIRDAYHFTNVRDKPSHFSNLDLICILVAHVWK